MEIADATERAIGHRMSVIVDTEPASAAVCTTGVQVNEIAPGGLQISRQCRRGFRKIIADEIKRHTRQRKLLEHLDGIWIEPRLCAYVVPDHEVEALQHVERESGLVEYLRADRQIR